MVRGVRFLSIYGKMGYGPKNKGGKGI